VQTADAAKDGLAAFINNHFGDENFAVWSSVLMRAQETAFYQLAGPANMPISVVPYVGEACNNVLGVPGMLGYCNENRPMARADQILAHTARNAGVRQRLDRGLDYRTPNIDRSRGAAGANAAVSDSKKFLAWLTKGRLDTWAANGKVDKGQGEVEYNVVLFTHSNFMKGAFGAVKSEISNNAAFFIRLGGGQHVVEKNRREVLKIDKGAFVSTFGTRTRTVQRCPLFAMQPFVSRRHKQERRRQGSDEKLQESPGDGS
jgi:broad specificity phosphatase PhoE